MGAGQSGPKEDSAEHPDNVKCVHEGWNTIRDKTRGCTDCCCIPLIIAMWIGMTFVGLVSLGAISDNNLKAGNPYRLTNTIDYEGNICGYTSGYKQKKIGYYLPDQTAVCVSSCPGSNSYNHFYCRYDLQSAADNSTTVGYQYVLNKQCMYYVKSTQYLNRCVPNTIVDTAATEFATYYNSSSTATYNTGSNGSSWFNSFLGDLYTLRAYIFGFGLGLTVGVSFIYLMLLRLPGCLFVLLWSIILGIQLLLIVSGILLYTLANSWVHDGKHTSYEITTMKVISYFIFAIAALYFCLIIVLRKRIQLAIAVVKQAARALSAMPTLLLLPIIQSIGLAIFLVPWLIYTLYLASSGDVKTSTGSYTYNGQSVTYTTRSFTYTSNTRYTFLYMLFCWFWTSEFIIAYGQLVIALSFTAWYFVREKTALATDNVRWAFQTAGIYHAGTAAFGSLVIAIIKTIRAIIAYIQKKAKDSKNVVLVYIMCILGCCMWCLEKIMKFINKHAYILTAIYGTSFCSSARKAFFLLLRNILRVAAVNMVSGFLIFIGSLFIPLLTTFICYLALAYNPSATNEASGIVSPLVFTFILSYWVASMFLEIFGMGIETILFCFIADEEMFKPEDRFADAELMTTVQRTAQAAAEAKIAPAESAPIDSKNEGAIVAKDNNHVQAFDQPPIAKPVGSAGPAVF
jgi:hypothetical protein